MKAGVFEFVWEVKDPAGYCWVECIGEPVWVPAHDNEADREIDSGASGTGDEFHLVEVASVEIAAQVISPSRAEQLAASDENWRLFLVEKPGDRKDAGSEGIRYVRPLRDFTGLFRIFADTSENPEGILGFAHRFGFLHDRSAIDEGTVLVSVPELYGEDEPVYAERFEIWRAEILAMREAVEIWDLACADDKSGLFRFIRRNRDGTLVFWTEARRYAQDVEILDDPDWPKIARIFSDTVDLLGPAKYVVSNLVNTALDEARVHPQLGFKLEDHSHHLAIVPENLLGAMWLQFARALDGNREYRACRHCGTWFEIGSGAASRARQFCSNRCRVAFSRLRKREREEGTA